MSLYCGSGFGFQAADTMLPKISSTKAARLSIATTTGNNGSVTLGPAGTYLIVTGVAGGSSVLDMKIGSTAASDPSITIPIVNGTTSAIVINVAENSASLNVVQSTGANLAVFAWRLE